MEQVVKAKFDDRIVGISREINYSCLSVRWDYIIASLGVKERVSIDRRNYYRIWKC